MSVDDPPGSITSFLDLFCDRHALTHVSLGRPGATNFVIRLQIDHAIRNHANFVIVAATGSDRFDIPVDQSPDWAPNIDLGCVHYHGYRAASSGHVPTRPIQIVSDVEYNLMNNIHGANLSPQIKQALKSYTAYLHHPSLVKYKEHFIIRDGLRALDAAGIPYVFLPAAMNEFDWSDFYLVWPREQEQPYTMIQKTGPYPYQETVTHNSQASHEQFCRTLDQITRDWALPNI